MPTISVNLKDLEGLLGPAVGAGTALSAETLERWLPLVKGELKDFDLAGGELRIELQDSNRPDLWSSEGIARQIRIKRTGVTPSYAVSIPSASRKRQITVAGGLELVRPYVAACTAVGYHVTADGLAQLIQTQEKLADIYGRQRKTVSIGFYRLPTIAFPVAYTLVKPDEARFTPLGFNEKLSLREILSVHPKGQEYGPILAGHDRLPLLRDQEGQILSMPPIINSREIGEVQVGDKALFVEVTGTDLRMVILTLNILAANLADRGATVEPVSIKYPYATALGETIVTPMDMAQPMPIPKEAIEGALGEIMEPRQIEDALRSYGYHMTAARGKSSVKLPPYRNDVMHVVDLVEDVAISRGYESFVAVMPSQFTVGCLSPVEDLSDRIRDLMVGMEFQEVMSNLLGSRSDLIDRMRLSGSPWDRLVDVDNVMVQTYSSLRQWMIPSLLRVEEASSRAFFPHRVFEVGEVAVRDLNDESGTRTAMMLGALIAHAKANFSEIHSCLDLLMFYLGLPYKLEPIQHPSFLEGRAGQILLDGQPMGIVGELHPEVLEAWQVLMPCVAFELEIEALLRRTIA